MVSGSALGQAKRLDPDAVFWTLIGRIMYTAPSVFAVNTDGKLETPVTIKRPSASLSVLCSGIP